MCRKYPFCLIWIANKNLVKWILGACWQYLSHTSVSMVQRLVCMAWILPQGFGSWWQVAYSISYRCRHGNWFCNIGVWLQQLFFSTIFTIDVPIAQSWCFCSFKIWYTAVIFIQNSHKRHTIARPLRWGMVCLLWRQSLIYILPYHSSDVCNILLFWTAF